MSLKLEVKPGIEPIAYDTLEEAVSPNVGSISNYEQIKGKRVSGTQYSSDTLTLLFDDTNYVVNLTIANNRIDCDISQDRKTTPSNSKHQIPGVLDLDFSGTSVTWNRELILNNFIGHVIALAPSEQYMFLYVKDVGDYMCSFLVAENENYSPFIYFSEY